MNNLVTRERQCSDISLDTLAYRMNIFQIQSIDTATSILDIGSQEGQFVNRVSLLTDIRDISCLDIVPEVVAAGKKRFDNVCWHCADIREFNFTREYDIMTWLNGYFRLRTQPERHSFLEKINLTLSDNGYFLVSFGDVNFEKLGLSFQAVADEISFVLKLVNIIRQYEYEPIQPIDGGAHKTYGRWYTSILARKNV